MAAEKKPITLQSLRADSRIVFPALSVGGIIPGGEITQHLQRAFTQQNLTISIAGIPPDGDIARDENRHIIRSHWPDKISRSQLEALMFISPGFTDLEIGELEKPLKRNGSAMSLIAVLRHEVPYTAGYYYSTVTSGTAPFWEVYGIEDNGNAHYLGTQH